MNYGSPIVLFLLGQATFAHTETSTAQPIAAQPGDSEGHTTDNDAAAVTKPATPRETTWGVTAQLRGNWLPEPFLEMFLTKAPTHILKPGFSVGAYRVKRDSELALTVGYESFNGNSGLAINKNEPIPQFEADYVKFDGFGWITLEASLHDHTPLTEKLDLRYGGTLGMTVTVGDILHTDYACTTSDPDTCRPRAGGAVDAPYAVPPVLGVVGGDIGVRYRATPKIDVTAGVGLRLLFLSAGVGVGYRFL